LSSDEETNAIDITLEQVIEECGSMGRYQYLHYFFLTFFPIATGIFNFYYVFGGAEPVHTCDVSHEISTKIVVYADKCSYLVKENFNESMEILPCTKWIYDRSVFGQTFTEEANFVCRYSVYRSFVATALQIGAMLIFFTGQLTDVIGRRLSIRLLVALLLITSVITQGLIQFIPMSINLK
jgi:hypothetical protein